MSYTKIVVFSLFGLCTAAVAKEAPWHWWVSSEGVRVCSQISLGAGWKQEKIPYKDARCRQVSDSK